MCERDGPPRIEFFDFDVVDERRREALMAMGNGVLSCRAASPESSMTGPSAGHYPGLYRAGWYDEAPREVNGRNIKLGALVNLPDPFGLSIALEDGAWFDLHDTEIREYRQSLDLEQGVVERHIRFILAGHELRLHERRFVSMADPLLAVLHWTLDTTDALPTVRLRSTLNGAVINGLVDRNRIYEGRRLNTRRFQQDSGGRAVLLAGLCEAGRRVVVASRTTSASLETELDWQAHEQNQRLTLDACCSLPAGGCLSLEKRVIVQLDHELPENDLEACRQALQRVPQKPFGQLLAEHRQAWAGLWQQLSLRAQDAELHTLLRFSAYHVLQTVSTQGIVCDQGVPARGWHEGYFGQIFWDEIFLSPYLATHFPQAVRSLLDYRYQRLDVARDRARRVGLRGAMFPWRSARSGEEETPPFQYYPLSGHWIADPTHLQRHVGAAVAYDAWQLYLATGERALLTGSVGELIIEVARFWSSLARYDASRERYVICGVIGPDEYHNSYPDADKPGLDNNAYTNLMAVWTLCRALDVLALLGDQGQALRQRLDLEPQELRRWEDISRRMYLPFLDGGIISQFEGYEKLLPAPEKWLTEERPRLDWMLEARHDSCDRYQLSKQADVLMILHLFRPAELRELFNRLGYPWSPDAIRRTANYHLARITHESSLSKMVCAGALAHIDPAASWCHFRECLRTDLDQPSEGGTLEGIHLGAMAGSLDVLQRHYLGIHLTVDGIWLFPAAPPDLDGVSLMLEYRGIRLTVTLSGKRVRMERGDKHGTPVTIIYAGGSRQLGPGDHLEVSSCEPLIQPDQR